MSDHVSWNDYAWSLEPSNYGRFDRPYSHKVEVLLRRRPDLFAKLLAREPMAEHEVVDAVLKHLTRSPHRTYLIKARTREIVKRIREIIEKADAVTALGLLA